MKLTVQNASEYLGKKLTGGLFHYWPLQVKKIGSKFFVTDRNGVSMPLDESSVIYFEKAE